MDNKSETTTDSGQRVESRNGFRITIPLLGGTKFEATGKDVFLTAIIVGVVVVLLRLDAHQEATAAIKASQDKVEEHISEMIYVLSLPQEKRDALKIEMPDSLRKKLRRQEQ